MAERRGNGQEDPTSLPKETSSVEKSWLEGFQQATEAYKETRWLIVNARYPSRDDDEEEQEANVRELENSRNGILDAYRKPLRVDLLKQSVLIDLSSLANTYYDEEAPADDPNRRIATFGLGIVEELGPEISQDIRNNMVDDRVRGLRLFHRLVIDGNEQQKKIGLDLLAQNIDLIEQAALDSDNESPAAVVVWLNEIRKKADSVEAKVKAIDVTLKIASQAEGEQRAYAMGTVFMDGLPEYPLRDFLKQHNLPFEEMVKSWWLSISRDPEKREKYLLEIIENVRAIEELEKNRPGVCKFLYDNCGIMDFGRYPVDLMVNQYDEWDNKDLPYGIAIFPRNDHNGAFYLEQHALGDLPEILKGQFALRVFECESKQDVGRALIVMDKKFGDKQKISLAIIGGHGKQDTIWFGGEDDRHKLTSSDLTGKGTAKARQFFSDRPTFILSSCSTGAEHGIGEELSRRFNAKLIAPKEPTATMKVYASKRPGREFRFNAAYSEPEKKNIYNQGVPEQKHA